MITVSRAHELPAQMLLRTLRHQTEAPIHVVGNLADDGAARMRALGAEYIDERDVDLSGRFPPVEWQAKYRQVGWYRQMFLRLAVDRYLDARHVIVLDSEVFCFDNWDENRFYQDGRLKSVGWTPEQRKAEWDYRMYRGAAELLRGLSGCEGAMEYVESDGYRRHISGVVLFSTDNLRHLWQRLEKETDLPATLDRVVNHEPELAFSDHDFYGIAADLGVFDDVDPPALVSELMGWYDRHPDPAFEAVTGDPMWSMCQTYVEHGTAHAYQRYIEDTAARLDRRTPPVPYWNPGDRELLKDVDDESSPTAYFGRYEEQLDHTVRARYRTMRTALDLLTAAKPAEPTIVEIGTSRDANVGGGHSTFKFGEYLSRQGGVLHSVDISAEAIDFSIRASADYLPWIRHHVSDSTAFLTQFQGTIDLLYLDGLDSTPGRETVAAEKQLEEIQAALPLLAPEAVVLLDDAALPLEGKTRLSSVFLQEHGFERVLDEYQRLFRRPPAVPRSALSSAVTSVRARLGSVVRAADRRAPESLRRLARRIWARRRRD
jgi:predicted O-methyltransferase YrrM